MSFILVDRYYVRMQEQVLQIQSLETDQPLPEEKAGFEINSQTITFFATVLPITIFAFITAITIHNSLKKQQKHISDAISGMKVALVVSSIPIGMALLMSQTSFSSKAERNPTPRNVLISEITNDSFELSWRTGSKTVGGYRIASDPELVSIFETKTNLETEKLSHIYTVADLDPDTEYFLEIFSEGRWYSDQGTPITIKTASSSARY